MDLTIWSPDGEPVPAYVARPTAPGPAVVVLHSAWGRLQDYIEMGDNLAASGFLAVVPDLFCGRTAANWTEAEQLAQERPSTTLIQAAVATVQWLRAQPDVIPKRMALLGFSLGGVTALKAAASGVVDAAVTFYGTPSLDTVANLRVPVLGHFAEADKYEPALDVTALFEALQRQGTSAAMVTYPGTGHCFCEPTVDTYDKTSAAKSWTTTLSFLRQHLRGAVTP
jgi:carboxymethylenebutenolidase